MVAVNADALVCLTRAVLPAISPAPLRYRLPLWSPTTATAIANRRARQIRNSDIIPYRRGQCTQYRWAAIGLRHLSWTISLVHDESRPRRRCARPTSRFTAAKSAPAGAAGNPGQYRAGGASGGDGRDTRDQAARRGIRRNWARFGTTPVAAVRASRIVRQGRATPAAGGCEVQQLTPHGWIVAASWRTCASRMSLVWLPIQDTSPQSCTVRSAPRGV
jgi:hypothetical protein